MRPASFSSFCLLSAFLRVGPNRRRAYQDFYASLVNGRTEVTAGDGTRCDIVTDTHAIEVDLGDKWAEAIGQSLNYSFQFNKRAGILLVLENRDDYRHYLRVNSIVQHYQLPIDVTPLKVYEGDGPKPPTATTPPQSSRGSGQFWISSTGKTHRPGCRYYGQGNGRASARGSGDNCRICGGAGR